MANAKRCDICGGYYQVPDLHGDDWFDERRNSSMVRLLRRKGDRTVDHDVFHFDSCEKCFQDVMDYILTKQAEWTKPDVE